MKLYKITRLARTFPNDELVGFNPNGLEGETS